MISDEELTARFKDLEFYAPLVGVRDQEFTYVVSTSDYAGGLKLFKKRPHLALQTSLICDWGQRSLECWPNSDKILLNVGAHVGTAVVPLVGYEYFNSAIVFEPEPLNAKLLKINLVLNDLEKVVTVHELALSDQNATVDLWLDEHRHGACAIFDREFALELQPSRDHEKDWISIKVECQTFDYFAYAHMIDLRKIGLVFVDIEGHEGHFFKGAQNLLRQRRVPIITELFSYYLHRSGGMDMFSDNVFKYFSRFIICSHPESRELKVCDIQDVSELSELLAKKKLYNIILIP